MGIEASKNVTSKIDGNVLTLTKTVDGKVYTATVTDTNKNGIFDEAPKYNDDAASVFTVADVQKNTEGAKSKGVTTPVVTSTPSLVPNFGMVGGLNDFGNTSLMCGFNSIGVQDVINKWTNIITPFSTGCLATGSDLLYGASMPMFFESIFGDITKAMSQMNCTYDAGPDITPAANAIAQCNLNANAGAPVVGDTGVSKTKEEIAVEKAEKKEAAATAKKVKEEKDRAAAQTRKEQQAAADAKANNVAAAAICKEFYVAMKNLGTDNVKLGKAINKVNKKNVLEVFEQWNKLYSTSMGNETLVASINNDVYIGEEKFINKLKSALIARAKELGLGEDAEAFDAKVSSENSGIWTNDSVIEQLFSDMTEKALHAKNHTRTGGGGGTF